MIDSMFYGLIFNASTPFNVSELVPFGTGYAGFLEGKVVDMFYFPLIVTTGQNGFQCGEDMNLYSSRLCLTLQMQQLAVE